MKNNQYWINRVSKITWQRYNDLEQENKKLLKFYQQAIDQVERELAKIAIKMQSNPSLSNQHNQKRLSELKSKMSKITEELMLKIKGFTEEQIHKAIINQYQDIIVKIVGNDFALPNEDLIKMMMDNPWSGANFSDRLWRNKSLLEFNLNEVLARGFIQGKTTVEIAKELSLRVEKNFNVCLRLVRTERMHYLNESSKKAYQDAGVKQLQYWAAEDERTCETCGNYHEKIMEFDEAPILPVHPNCRCTYVPVIEITE
ncbi:minor capsid protein [Turicibacter sanguinis]|uniref:minor capsid protein n=1 Tax=Turicibacter sanguinis TaxID=154288 RepID=UPI0006C6A196|nr:minor capsid protein [Turicibacter sanguinis]MDB8438610.1 minor capsid protein [Turicibacter sanguinis]MTO25253.1 phage head morphogenesis protein [Turicibacter sanguinis]MTO28102.1 phage head morphogenesis protein [Turicibacter sanguinis]MTO90999.1 phage head morphogenesis protein [Turicibacter sanguinis]MTP71230.1 phage head morphogenesis protein [Turicibacter sanguinis]